MTCSKTYFVGKSFFLN